MIYKVTYISSSDDDCCSVHISASSPENAMDKVLEEFWDVKEIIDCYELD